MTFRITFLSYCKKNAFKCSTNTPKFGNVTVESPNYNPSAC